MSDNAKQLTIHVSDSLGAVSGILMTPEKPKAAVVLAHGAGAGMTHSFMSSLASELAAHDLVSLRFNFPYVENGKKRPNPPAIAEKVVASATDELHRLYPGLPLFVSGKSFGGRMASQRLAKECPSFVKGLIFFGFPLHAPGKVSVDRAEHLKGIKIPMLFLQGTRDALADIKSMEKVCSGLSSATLVKFDGADHSFKAGKNILVKALAEKSAQWIKSPGS